MFGREMSMERKFRIGVYGAGIDTSFTDLLKKAREVGRAIAEKGHILVTGGCGGLPHAASLAAYRMGGETIAFSPAVSLEEHIHVYGYPSEGFSKIVFVPREFKYAHDPDVCRKFRNVMSVAYVDAAIIINGRIGTLNEFTIAYDLGKPIGVLKNSGGITTRVLPILLEDVKKPSTSKIIFEEDPKKLVDSLLSIL